MDAKQHNDQAEIKLSRFASLLSDAGFKAVLAAPRNKSILMRLLNLLLPEDRQIVEIERYCDREIGGFTPSGKYSRVDVRCRDREGRTFIVEMQRELHECFFQRCVWYGSNAYGSDLPSGAAYKELQPVYVIAFLEQSLPHAGFEKLWSCGEYVSRYQMTEKRTGEFAPDTIVCIFVELGRFLKVETELKERFDRMCYVFKNSEKWADDVPQEILDDEFTSDLSRACEVENFPPDTKLQYIRDMFTEMDYRAEMDSCYDRGFRAGEAKGEARGRTAGMDEGMEKGMEKGGAARSRDIAAAMLSKGLDAALVASCTGLSVEEISGLQ